MRVKGKYICKHTGYVKFYLSDGRVVNAHRWIMEHYLGRKLDYNEVVHHCDEDKTRNRLSNMDIRLRSQHSRYHHKPKTMIELVCDYCGEIFFREKGNVRPERKAVFCSRRCMGKKSFLVTGQRAGIQAG